MANTLRFKRGLVATIPTALAGEPLFTTDTFDLYIGNGTTNTRFQKYIASGTTSQLLRGDGSLLTMPIVLTSPSNGQVLKYNGTSWVNDSDSGITGSGAAGQVSYWNGTNTQTGSNNLFWDATNSRLGIGTNAPAVDLEIGGTGTRQIRILSSGGVDLRMNADTGARVGTYSNTALAFHTNSTEKVRIDANGSVGIGTTSLSNTNLNVNKNLTGLANVYGIFNSGSIRSDVTTGAQMFTSAPSIQNAVFTLAGLKHFEAVGISSVGSATITTQFGFYVESTLSGATTNYGFYGNIAAATGRWNIFMDGTANNFMRGSLLVGTSTTSTGELLQVNGTMRVTGASTFGGAINTTSIITSNTYVTAGTTASPVFSDTFNLGNPGNLCKIQYGNEFNNTNGSYLRFIVNSASAPSTPVNALTLSPSGAATFSSTITSTQTNGFTIGGLLNAARIQYGSDAATSFSLLTAANAFAGLYASNAIFSSSVTAASFIPTSSTVPTNGMYLSAANTLNFATNSGNRLSISSAGLVTFSNNARFTNNNGLLFENASASPVGSIKMGTGATSPLEITNGTHTITLATLGTFVSSNLLVGAPTIGASSTNTIAVANGTAPSSSATDIFHMYSADVVAGNAAPHFRTENGAVIKLYQQDNSVAAANFVAGIGSSVTTLDAFDGYTIGQVVKALRNAGILS